MSGSDDRGTPQPSDCRFRIPACPRRGSVSSAFGDAGGCGCRRCCCCSRDVEIALRKAIETVLGDLAAKGALGLDKKSAVIAIAEAERAALGCKSLSTKVHARWTPDHVAVHGELPSDRTMRRWYRAALAERQQAQDDENSVSDPAGDDRDPRAASEARPHRGGEA